MTKNSKSHAFCPSKFGNYEINSSLSLQEFTEQERSLNCEILSNDKFSSVPEFTVHKSDNVIFLLE